MYLCSFGMIYDTSVLTLGNDTLYYINIAQLSKKSGRIDMNVKILPHCRFAVKICSLNGKKGFFRESRLKTHKPK